LTNAKKLYHDQPPLPWQRNLRKNGYNSACARDISDIRAYDRVFWIKLSNDVRQISKGPTQVAMATKSETKSAITQLVLEISPRCLRLTGGFRCWAIEGCPKTTNPRCCGNKIETKSSITRLEYETSRLTLVAMATKLQKVS